MIDTSEIAARRAAQDAARAAIKREFRDNTREAGSVGRRAPVFSDQFAAAVADAACTVRDSFLSGATTNEARYDAGRRAWGWLDASVLRSDDDPRLTDEDHRNVREAVMRALGIYPEIRNPKPGDRFPNGEVYASEPDAAADAAEVVEIRKRQAAEARALKQHTADVARLQAGMAEIDRLEQRIAELRSQPAAIAAERRERLDAYLLRWKTKKAEVCRAAQIDSSVLRQWRRGELRDGLKEARRIEAVLCGGVPPQEYPEYEPNRKPYGTR